MKSIKIFAIIFFVVLALPTKIFAAAPDISAGQTYFDIFKGYYVLKDNVRVVTNNHGLNATITADEARVSILNQKCWADGNVKFSHEDVTFSCNRAYLQWKTKTADVVGKVNFVKTKSVAITSDTASFNWSEKIVDFYGNVEVKAKKELNFEEGVKLKKKKYSHVQYNVREDKILLLEENSEVPEIVIPEPDKEK